MIIADDSLNLLSGVMEVARRLPVKPKDEWAAIAAIEKAGRPLNTNELLEQLEAAGIRVGGKNPAGTLSARLSRAEGLENVRPYGWRVRSAVSADHVSLHTAEKADPLHDVLGSTGDAPALSTQEAALEPLGSWVRENRSGQRVWMTPNE